MCKQLTLGLRGTHHHLEIQVIRFTMGMVGSSSRPAPDDQQNLDEPEPTPTDVQNTDLQWADLQEQQPAQDTTSATSLDAVQWTTPSMQRLGENKPFTTMVEQLC